MKILSEIGHDLSRLEIVKHYCSLPATMSGNRHQPQPFPQGAALVLLKEHSRISPEAVADLDASIAMMTAMRTTCAWIYKEQLREIPRVRFHVDHRHGDVPNHRQIRLHPSSPSATSLPASPSIPCVHLSSSELDSGNRHVFSNLLTHE